MRAAVLFLLLAAPAGAACQDTTEIFACKVGTKTLEICEEASALVYRFGPETAPELTIAEPLATVAYAPYSGFGRTRHYTVTFQNAGIAYEVWTGTDRGTTRIEGGITVTEGGTTLAKLTCTPGSATRELESIGLRKQDLGQCFDQETEVWRQGPCGRNPEFCAC
jgi:hypothetical protein